MAGKQDDDALDPDAAVEKADAARAADYFSRAAMRGRMAAAVGAGPVALLDLGAAKTAALIARIDPDAPGGPLAGVEALGVGVTQTRGVADGAVVDMVEASRSVAAALAAAEAEAGLKTKTIIAATSAGRLASVAVAGETTLKKGVVRAGDLAAAVGACRPPDLAAADGPARQPIHAVAVNWTLDAERRIRDPRGMAGKRLGVDMHVVTAAEPALRTLANLCARVGRTLAGVVAAPYAAGLAALDEEARDEGAAVIDLGAGATGAALFLRGRLVSVDVAPVGGGAWTEEIARSLGATLRDAERAKAVFGLAGGDADRAALDPKRVADTLRPRVVETLELMRDRLDRAGFGYLPTRRVAFVGGGADLAGLVGAAAPIFGPNAARAEPPRPPGASAALAGPSFATLVGLAMYLRRPPETPWSRDALAASAEPKPKTAVRGFWRFLVDGW